MTQIKTIVADTADDFDRKVNELLADGWRLHGIAFFTATSHQTQDVPGASLQSWSKRHFAQVLAKD
jgi:hypothetical protein